MGDPKVPPEGPKRSPSSKQPRTPEEPAQGAPAAPHLRVFPGRRRRGDGSQGAGAAVGSPDSLLVRLQTLEVQVEEALARSRVRATGVGEDFLAEGVTTVLGLYTELRHRAARMGDLAARLRLLGRGVAVDEFGYDPEAAKWIEPVLDGLFRYWWRVETPNVHRVPTRGPVVLVANHGGALLPYDALMIAAALRLQHPARRRARPLIENFLYQMPHVGTLLSRVGGVTAKRSNARRLLADGHAIIVFPEGAHGLSKSYRQRYRLQRFGRGEFVSLCLETGAVLVPVSVIGSEEAYPVVARAVGLGRLLGLPHLPITPTFPWLGALGLVPLPTKWTIRFGEPIDLASFHEGADPDDLALVARLREEIRQRIQRMVLEGLRRRRSIFLG